MRKPRSSLGEERKSCNMSSSELDLMAHVIGQKPPCSVVAGSSHGSPFECFKRTCNSGGVCKRHCRALFKKHVFPMLFNPQPMVAPLGQAVSTGMSGRVLVEDGAV